MMRRLGDALEDAVLEGVGRVSSRTQEHRPLDADLLESDDAYLVVFDAPGATASDVDVQFDDHTVRVRIDRFRKPHTEYDMAFPGRGTTLRGHMTLPHDAAVDATNAEATLAENGTLRVEIPKTESAPETIELEEED